VLRKPQCLVPRVKSEVRTPLLLSRVHLATRCDQIGRVQRFGTRQRRVAARNIRRCIARRCAQRRVQRMRRSHVLAHDARCRGRCSVAIGARRAIRPGWFDCCRAVAAWSVNRGSVAIGQPRGKSCGGQKNKSGFADHCLPQSSKNRNRGRARPLFPAAGDQNRAGMLSIWL